MKKLIERIRSKSSRSNRVRGQIKTILATTAATTLTMGLVTNPFGILTLTVITLVLGGSAAKNAIKYGEEENSQLP